MRASAQPNHPASPPVSNGHAPIQASTRLFRRSLASVFMGKKFWTTAVMVGFAAVANAAPPSIRKNGEVVAVDRAGKSLTHPHGRARIGTIFPVLMFPRCRQTVGGNRERLNLLHWPDCGHSLHSIVPRPPLNVALGKGQ
jgi:hypothetical protein